MVRYTKTLNTITEILVSATLIVALFFGKYLKFYSYALIPILVLNSLVNIYMYIKDKESRKSKLISAIFWLTIIILFVIINII